MLAGPFLPFTVALALMLLIGLVEAIGLGGFAVDWDADLGDAPLLGWLGFGSLPFLMLLVLFLALFGITGMAIQQALAALTGGMLPGWLAALAATVAALPGTGLLARPLAALLPRDETSAIDIDELAGRRAVIVISGDGSRIQHIQPVGQPVLVKLHGGQQFIDGQIVDCAIIRRRDRQDRTHAVSPSDPPGRTPGEAEAFRRRHPRSFSP